MSRKIVLIGMPTCGKTTTAKLLGKLWGCGWVDTDSLIEQDFGQPIAWLFENLGEEGFRALEYQAVCKALRGEQRIVSLGGGAVTYEPTRQLLREHSVYYLCASPDYLANRIDKSVTNSQKGEAEIAIHTTRPLLVGDYRSRLKVLYAQRHAVYEATADVTVDAQTQREAVVSAIVEHEERVSGTITVTGSSTYAVVFGENLNQMVAELVPAEVRRVLVLCAPPLQDRAQILADYLANLGVLTQVMSVPDGEAAKQLDVLAQVWDKAANFGLERRDLIIPLGGGATTDLGGFAAATWLRGVRVLQVPTSLLAMVDAAVGGKTGIDWRTGKNLVGSFYPPIGVAVNMAMLKTLPPEEIVAGLGEALKCGFIQDPEILRIAQESGLALTDPENQSLYEVIRRAIAVKAKVVSADLYEAGCREWLNYGHTLAHAIELSQNYEFSHGRAVAIGMVYAAHLGALLEVGPSDLPNRIKQQLENVGLPTTFTQASFQVLLQLMAADKKVRDSTLRFVLLKEIGKPTVMPVVNQEILYEAARMTGIPL